METHHLKLVEATVQFLQFMTSVLIIVLTATGAAFYYFWTTKINEIKMKHLWPLVLPAGSVFGAFIFMGITYRILVDGLAEGTISRYMEFWFEWVGLILWGALGLSIGTLLIAFIVVHRKGHKK